MSVILVTGGAGYIGSHTVKELLTQGHQPIVLDNLQTGHRESVRNALLIEGDLSDRKKIEETFQLHPIDAVIHFAADCLVGESVRVPQKYFNNNVKNGLQLLEIMEKFSIRNIVFSSSATVYGEADKAPISEDHPCVPINPYGETKWIFERVLQALSASGKIKSISLRYFNAAGADSSGKLGEDHSPETHLIPIGLAAVLNGNPVSIFGTDYDTPDGTCIRDYIHTEDLAQAHVLALNHLQRGGDSGVYNLGNGKGYSVKEVLQMVRQVTGKSIRVIESPRRPGDPARLVARGRKIMSELGWKPKYPDLETIVETAWKWHREHPNGYGDKHRA